MNYRFTGNRLFLNNLTYPLEGNADVNTEFDIFECLFFCYLFVFFLVLFFLTYEVNEF